MGVERAFDNFAMNRFRSGKTFGGSEDEHWPARLHNRVSSPGGGLNLLDFSESPLHRGSDIVIQVWKIRNNANLVAVTAEERNTDVTKFGLIVVIQDTYVNRAVISLSSMTPKIVLSEILKPFACKMGSTAPDSAGSMYLYACQAAAVGPVSASPSPTTQATTRSGLSITAPKETLRAYPSSPPS